jgi:hypothetical protein
MSNGACVFINLDLKNMILTYTKDFHGNYGPNSPIFKEIKNLQITIFLWYFLVGSQELSSQGRKILFFLYFHI